MWGIRRGPVNSAHKWQVTRKMFPFDDVIMFLWLSDVILRNRYWPTLAQVMARCLTVPSHHINHCWLILKAVLWNVAEDNFTKTVPDIIRYKTFEKLSNSKIPPYLPYCIFFLWKQHNDVNWPTSLPSTSLMINSVIAYVVIMVMVMSPYQPASKIASIYVVHISSRILLT